MNVLPGCEAKICERIMSEPLTRAHRGCSLLAEFERVPPRMLTQCKHHQAFPWKVGSNTSSASDGLCMVCHAEWPNSAPMLSHVIPYRSTDNAEYGQRCSHFNGLKYSYNKAKLL